jgi:hypothetical protein
MAKGRNCATGKSGGIARISAFLAMLVSVGITSRSDAIVTFGGTGRNTSAPTGALANSGWQYEGLIGSFTGTAISPNSFITAQHIGNMLGGSFQFDGQNYPVAAATDDPYSDLVVYTVNGTLPTYAPLYTSPTGEAGNSIVMYGRGVDRGTPVTVNGQLKGWQWGGGDNSLSWGTNTVTGAYGSMYGWQFSNNGDPNQAQVASGDSGGGVFIDSGGVWELAGVINSVQDLFSLDGTGATAMSAALFDTSGLYQAWGPTFSPMPNGPGPNPTWGYATSIESHATFIQAALGSPVPEPTFTFAALSGILLLRRSRSSRI